MEKTAMQELIEWANERSHLLNFAHEPIIKKTTELLAKEKEQIERAHNKANENWEKGIPTPITDGDIYYNSTYQVK